MGYEEIASLDANVTVSIGKRDKKTGKKGPTTAEGYYLGNRTVQTSRGEAKLHFLKFGTEDVAMQQAYELLGVGIGETLGIWGTTDMNRKLSQVTPGQMVLITSTGTKPTPNGDMYTYSVKKDPRNTIEVTAQADSGTVTSYADDEETATDEDSTEESNDDSDAQAAILAAERKAKFQAALNRGKSKTK